jgi:sortase (surface protein transpeptidase)
VYDDPAGGYGDRAPRTSAGGRLLTTLTWTVLLAGLWLWACHVTRAPQTSPGTGTDGGSAVTGSAAVGRSPGAAVVPEVPGAVRSPGVPRPHLPPAARPLPPAAPQRIDIPGLGVQAPVVARGLDARGAVDPPPLDQAGVVGWYAAGTAPGAAGAALMVGHLDTATRPAVFHGLGTMRPGQTVRVVRADGRVAEFTVDDVRVLPRDGFDAHQAYGVRQPGRAELRLITCGGVFDRASRDYTANVVVSAHLTGTAG